MSAVLTTGYLIDKIVSRLQDLTFKQDDETEPTPLKLYRQRPMLRGAPSQGIDHSYAIRIRRSRNTKQQRVTTGIAHVVHGVELQIARRMSNKDYIEDERFLSNRAEQIASWLMMKSLGGYDAEWEETLYETDTNQSILYATIVLSCSGFWQHARQHSG